MLQCLTVNVICSSVKCTRLPKGQDSPSDSATVLPVGAPFSQMEWYFWTGLILDLLDGVLPRTMEILIPNSDTMKEFGLLSWGALSGK